MYTRIWMAAGLAICTAQGCKKKATEAEQEQAQETGEAPDFKPFKELSAEEIAAGRGRVRDGVLEKMEDPIALKVEHKGKELNYKNADLEKAFYGDVIGEERTVRSIPMKDLADRLEWTIAPDDTVTLFVKGHDPVEEIWATASAKVVDWRLGKPLREHQAAGKAKGERPKDRKKTQRFIEKIVITSAS